MAPARRSTANQALGFCALQALASASSPQAGGLLEHSQGTATLEDNDVHHPSNTTPQVVQDDDAIDRAPVEGW